MTKEQWDKIRANAAKAARGTKDEAAAEFNAAEVARHRAGWALEERIHAGEDTTEARAAFNAALAAELEAKRNLRAHEVAETSWEERDRWWGWSDDFGRPWSSIRRFM